MAILQISKIQSRRGLQEDLPQLASAEIGWAIDTQQLYIGNGDITEGAPYVGNTEILTVNSDIFSLNGTYTYKGLAAGYQVQTGLPNALTPVSRSMQDKFDDFANFRDFGGIGDGASNNVEQFNNAIAQLYKIVVTGSPTTPSQIMPELRRRTLYIPAGVYYLTGDFIRWAPYVRLVGDGKNSTFIVQTDVTQPCVISSCDSYDSTVSIPYPNTLPVTGFLYTDIYTNVQSNTTFNLTPGTIQPGWLEAEGISFINQTDNDVVYLDSVTDVFLNRIAMQGPNTSAPLTAGSSHACVKIGNVAVGSQNISSKIVLRDCDYVGENYAVYCDDNLSSVSIIGGSSEHLFRGVCLGDATSNVSATMSSIRVSYVIFDDITKEAIYSPRTDITDIVSAFNTFNNVGSFPTAAVNMFGSSCYSFGDAFGPTYVGTSPGINLNDGSSLATLPNGKLLIGRQLAAGGTSLGQEVLLTTSGNVGVIGSGIKGSILEYSITSLSTTNQRIGIMKIVTDGVNPPIYDDDYVETTSLGVTLTPTLSSGTILLTYVNSGLPVTFKSSTRTFI